MDHGVTSLDVLRAKLAAGRRSAWVRALIGPAGDEPKALLCLQAVVGPRLAAWRKQMWMYPQCTFTSAQMTTRRLASIFEVGEPGEPRTISVGRTRSTIEVHPGQFPFVHAPSLAQYDELRLPWPSLVYNPTMVLANANAPHGYLIGAARCPIVSAVLSSVQGVLRRRLRGHRHRQPTAWEGLDSPCRHGGSDSSRPREGLPRWKSCSVAHRLRAPSWS